VAPNIEAPKTPISLIQPRPPTPSSIPTKLTVNFVLPYKSEIANKEVYARPRLPPFPRSHI
jgi:F-type H+-transporting ATPase subunit delta